MSNATLERPPHLPEHLAAIWEEMEPQLSPRIGSAGMEALCTQIYRARDAEKRITEEGIVVADAKGNPVEHPALAIEKKAQGEIRTWVTKFARPRGPY